MVACTYNIALIMLYRMFPNYQLLLPFVRTRTGHRIRRLAHGSIFTLPSKPFISRIYGVCRITIEFNFALASCGVPFLSIRAESDKTGLTRAANRVPFHSSGTRLFLASAPPSAGVLFITTACHQVLHILYSTWTDIITLLSRATALKCGRGCAVAGIRIFSFEKVSNIERSYLSCPLCALFFALSCCTVPFFIAAAAFGLIGIAGTIVRV